MCVNKMNRMEDDKLWVEYHEENSTSSEEVLAVTN